MSRVRGQWCVRVSVDRCRRRKVPSHARVESCGRTCALDDLERCIGEHGRRIHVALHKDGHRWAAGRVMNQGVRIMLQVPAIRNHFRVSPPQESKNMRADSIPYLPLRVHNDAAAADLALLVLEQRLHALDLGVERRAVATVRRISCLREVIWKNAYSRQIKLHKNEKNALRLQRDGPQQDRPEHGSMRSAHGGEAWATAASARKRAITSLPHA